MEREDRIPVGESEVTPEIERPGKAVVLISGGLDSTVAAAVAKDKGNDLYFMFVDYGQKTVDKERECVSQLADHYTPQEVKTIELPWLKEMGGSALFDPDTPLDEQNFKLEYVPFRNTIMLSAATAWAEVLDAGSVYVGSSGGDHICPDNSPSYLNAMQHVIFEGTMLKKDITLEAPLIETDKIGAVEIGLQLDVPFELTWSCHNGNEKACGHCSNCRSRLEAFEAVGAKDPIPYEEEEPEGEDHLQEIINLPTL